MTGCSPADVRAILEGYCLDQEFIQTVSIKTVTTKDIVVMAEDVRLLPWSKIESECLPDGTRIVDKAGLALQLTQPAMRTGDFQANIIQYSALSDSWLINTRDNQIVPVVRRMTGVDMGGIKRVTEYHSGTGSTILILNRRPIVKLHAINLITNPENWVYVSPSSVDPIAEEGILKLKAVLETWQNYVPAFPRGTDNIKVDYEYGYDQVPADICRAICMLTASQALALVGARAGGGSLGVQGFNKNYGDRGKWTDIRNELEGWAHALLRPYVMGMIGG